MDMIMDVDFVTWPRTNFGCSSDLAATKVLPPQSSNACSATLGEHGQDQEQAHCKSELHHFVPRESILPAKVQPHPFRDMPRHKPRLRNPLRRARTHEEPLLRQLLLHLHWKKQEELRSQEEQAQELANDVSQQSSSMEQGGTCSILGQRREHVFKESEEQTVGDAENSPSAGYEACWDSTVSIEKQRGISRGLDLVPLPVVPEESSSSEVGDRMQETSQETWQLQVRQPETLRPSSLPFLPSLSPFWGPTTFLGEQGQIFLGPPSGLPPSNSVASSKLQDVSLPLSFLSHYSQSLGDMFLIEDSTAIPFSIEEFEEHHLRVYLPQLELF